LCSRHFLFELHFLFSKWNAPWQVSSQASHRRETSQNVARKWRRGYTETSQEQARQEICNTSSEVSVDL
jgi:hypothetical protein